MKTLVGVVLAVVLLAVGIWLVVSLRQPAAPVVPPPEPPKEAVEAEPEPEPQEVAQVEEVETVPEAEAPEEAVPEPTELRIAGTVVDAASGAPVPGARVAALRGVGEYIGDIVAFKPEEGASPTEVASAETDAQGIFSLTLATERGLQLECDAEGYALARRPIAWDREEEVTVDFRLWSSNSVAGRVTDAATGAGIEGARVAVMSHSENMMEMMGGFRGGNVRLYTCETGPDGSYQCERVEPGKYRVFPNAVEQGYMPVQGPPMVVSVETGKSPAGIDFALEAGATLILRVVDPEGQPVRDAGAAVLPGQFIQAAMDGMRTQQFSAMFREGKTDEQGECRFGGLSFDTEYRARAGAEGFADVVGPLFRLTRDQAEQRQDLQLTAGSTVSGRTKYANGRAAVGVKVTLAPNLGGIFSGTFHEPKSVRSETNGAFTLEHVPAGEFTLMAGDFNPMMMVMGSGGASVPVKADGVAPVSGLELIVSEEAGGQKAASTIRGTVLGPDAKPVEAAQVVAARTGMTFNRKHTRSDKDGGFEFEDLDAGAYDLTAEADAGYAKQAWVEAGAKVTLRLANPTEVSGRVVDAKGGPASECVVNLKKPDAGEANWMDFGQVEDSPSTKSGADGTFLLRNVPPGDYVAEAASPTLGKGESKPISLAAGAKVTNVVIRMQAGVRFAGEVRDASGQPVSGALVNLKAVKEGSFPFGDFVPGLAQGGLSTSSTENGEFELAQVPQGTYAVTAGRSGYANSAPQEVVVGGQDVSGVTVVLPKGGSAHGQFTKDGRPVPNAMVQLVGPNGIYLVSTDSEGNFNLDGVTPGRYIVQAIDTSALSSGNSMMNAAQGPQQVVSVGDEQDVPIDFTPAGDLGVSGTVSGENLGNITTVSIRRPGGPAPEDVDPGDINALLDVTEYYAGYAMVNPDGTFSVEGLATGTYILEVFSVDVNMQNPDIQGLMNMDRTPNLRQELVVQEGGNATLNLVLPER